MPATLFDLSVVPMEFLVQLLAVARDLIYWSHFHCKELLKRQTGMGVMHVSVTRRCVVCSR